MSQKIAYFEAVIGADITNFRREMRNVRSDLGGVEGSLSSLRRVGRNMTFAITAPMVALGGAAVNAAADFDAAMRNVNSIALMSEDSLAAVSQRTLEWGANIRSGPTAAAESLYNVFSAGITDTEEAFKIMEISTMTAEAGLADLQITTEALTASLLAYGLGSESAERASNALTRMVQLGVGEMENFAGSVGLVVPAAANLGLEIEDVYAHWAILTQRGMSASRAATTLNASLSSLSKPTEAMKNAFKELGVSGVEELINKFGSYDRVLQELIGTTDNTSEEIRKLFNLERGARGIDAFRKSIEDWDGAMEDFYDGLDTATMSAWEQQMMSASAQFDILKSGVQALGIQIGNVLLPMLLPVVDVLTNIFTRLNDVNPNILRLGVGISIVTAALPPLMWLFSAIVAPMATTITLVSLLATAFSTILAPILDYMSPLLDELSTSFNGIKETVNTFMDEVFTSTVEMPPLADILIIPETIDPILIDIPITPGLTLSHIWSDPRYHDQLAAIFPTRQDFYAAARQMEGGGMISGETLHLVLQAEASLAPVSTPTYTITTPLVDRVSKAASAAYPIIKSNLTTIFTTLGNWIGTTLLPTVVFEVAALQTAITGWFNGINWEQVRADFALASGQLLTIGEDIVASISEGVVFASDWVLINILNPIGTLARNELAWDGIDTLLDEPIGNMIASAIEKIGESFRNFSDEFNAEDLGGVVQKIINVGSDIAGALLEGIIIGLGVLSIWVWDSIVWPLTKEIVKSIPKTLVFFAKLGVGILVGLVRGFADELGAAATWVTTNIVQPILDGAESAAETLYAGFRDWGAGIVAAIKEGLNVEELIGWVQTNLIDPLEGLLNMIGIEVGAGASVTPTMTSYDERRVQGIHTGAGSRSFESQAIGGPVTAGRLYNTHFGANQGEMFIPNVSGVVIPNGRANIQDTPTGGDTYITENHFHESTNVDQILFELQRRGIALG